ncbi:hypothetical protein ACIBQ2_14330 [Micromonospora sediminimaris]
MGGAKGLVTGATGQHDDAPTVAAGRRGTTAENPAPGSHNTRP